jgi:hypothetical protein
MLLRSTYQRDYVDSSRAQVRRQTEAFGELADAA